MTALFFLALTGCLTGNGESVTELRDISGFTALSVTNNIPADFFVADETSVAVICDSNLIEYVITDLRGDTLVVRTPNNRVLQPATDCYVAITGPDLREVEVSGSADAFVGGPVGLERASASGSGSVEVEEVDSDALSVDISGSGGARLGGAVGMLELDISGSGGGWARDLEAVDAEVQISGSGGAEVTVTGHLVADLSGSGSLDVYGDPQQVDQETSGSGDVNIH